jgi:hypothetical protein
MERGIGPDTPGMTFDHSLYAALLRECVDDEGWVDYVRLEARVDELDAYLERIAAANRAALSRYEDLALLLNAYNAFTLRLILDHPGIESIQDIPSSKRWEDERWAVGGEEVSLEDLEHDWIRTGFTEPRIHFALVCAARSCPRLRREPYQGMRLIAQLEDQGRHFFSRESNLRFDPDERTIYVNEILDWFRGDFTADGSTIPEFVSRYADELVARQMLLVKVRLEVDYNPYDWRLNGSWR